MKYMLMIYLEENALKESGRAACYLTPKENLWLRKFL